MLPEIALICKTGKGRKVKNFCKKKELYLIIKINFLSAYFYLKIHRIQSHGNSHIGSLNILLVKLSDILSFGEILLDIETKNFKIQDR